MISLIQAPNEILRRPCQKVDMNKVDVSATVEQMKKVMLAQKDPEGVGLAANQVGLPYRLFLARFSTKKNEPIRVFINPSIVEHSEEFIDEKKNNPLEGCLSVPKFYGVVKRWKWIKVRFKNYDLGNKNLEDKEEKFENFPATVIQHEMDHLDGKIFVERILEQNGKLYKVTGNDKKGKEVWEEVEI